MEAQIIPQRTTEKTQRTTETIRVTLLQQLPIFSPYNEHKLRLYNKIILATLFLLPASMAFGQNRWSFSTDFDVLHNFKKQQHYWAVGQFVVINYHVTRKDGIYGWIGYHTDGKYKNELTAFAKSPLTNPQQVDYTNRGRMNFRELSFGWRHYLKGADDVEKGWGAYSLAGLGIMFGKITNVHSVIVDTATYNLPVLSGTASFRRITLDLGLGIERPLGGDIFLYSEAKIFVPISSYPTQYLRISNYAPLTATLNVGVRILF